MALQWFFKRDGETFGPHAAERMKELAAGGELRPEDLVWKEGMAEGVRASRVDKLFARTAAAPAVDPAEPAGIPAAEATGPGPALVETQPADEIRPEELPPARKLPPPPAVRQRRVLSIKGGAVVSQDGGVVRYRKACLKCGHGDNSVTTAPIQCGTTRAHFFCPKCRKNQPVEIHSI